MWKVVFGVLLAQVHAVVHVLPGSTDGVEHATLVWLYRDGAGQLLEGLEAQERLAGCGALVEATST